MPGDSPTANELAAVIERRLHAAGEPARAAGEKRYLKSDLTFHGTGKPKLRAVVAATLAEHGPLGRRRLLAVARALWKRPVFECRGAAADLLERHTDLLTEADLTLLERFIRDSHTWALVDWLAIPVAGPLVEREPALGPTLDRWAADDDFWVRRAALIALLPPLRRGDGDFERFGRYADAMLDEREFFIRKAIGWVLRETAKRRPARVADWLLPRAGRASGVTLREAVKYLPATDRARILAQRGRSPRAAR